MSEKQDPAGSLGVIPKFLRQFVEVPGFSVTAESQKSGKLYIIEAREVSREEFDQENMKADTTRYLIRITQDPETN